MTKLTTNMVKGGLNVSVLGRQDNAEHNIVPRTPHSRSGRAEEGFTENDLHDDDAANFATYRQQQTEPLLASSASTSFPVSGYRSRGDDQGGARTSPWRKHLTGKKLLSHTPLLLGTVVAGALLSLIIVSLNRPDILDNAIGYSEHTATIAAQADIAHGAKLPEPTYVDTYPSHGHRISYQNYTNFPLTGQEYRNECSKLMAGKFMHHSGYWAPPSGGIMDVPHHDDVTDYHLFEGERTTVCTKTITYQLDGHVGLVADLALMAQAAALAREVRHATNNLTVPAF